MNKYNKILVGKKSEKNKCFANDGDILFIASNTDKFKGRLPKNGHFFISLNDRQPSLYGWVKESDIQYTPLDIAKMDYKSRYKKDPDDEFITDEELKEYEDFLKKINNMKVNTAMAVDWTEQLNMDTYQKEKSLWLHKVKFYKAS